MLLQPNIVLAEEITEILYCPEKIECSKDKSISSCKAVGEHIEYWDKITNNGTVEKGSYFLTSVISAYQDPNAPFNYYEPRCFYSKNIDDSSKNPLNASLQISPKSDNSDYKSSFWEANQNDTSKWHGWIEGSQVYCQDNITTKDCPLKQIPLVRVKFDTTSLIEKISPYANGIQTECVNYPWHSWCAINEYKAWDSCSDRGLCTIELMARINQALVDVGSIVVDMDNRMNIVYVHAITGFEISHDKQLNSIEIKPAS